MHNNGHVWAEVRWIDGETETLRSTRLEEATLTDAELATSRADRKPARGDSADRGPAAGCHVDIPWVAATPAADSPKDDERARGRRIGAGGDSAAATTSPWARRSERATFGPAQATMERACAEPPASPASHAPAPEPTPLEKLQRTLDRSIRVTADDGEPIANEFDEVLKADGEPLSLEELSTSKRGDGAVVAEGDIDEREAAKASTAARAGRETVRTRQLVATLGPEAGTAVISCNICRRHGGGAEWRVLLDGAADAAAAAEEGGLKPLDSGLVPGGNRTSRCAVVGNRGAAAGRDADSPRGDRTRGADNREEEDGVGPRS